MNQDLYVLEDLFIRLQGSSIVGFSYGQDILRFQLQTAIASQFLPNSMYLHLVLQGCYQIYYLSYTQIQESRLIQDSPEKIFAKGFVIQGIELRNRENPVQQVKEGFIMFCNSYLNTIEAGELHFTANGFQLYDQEYGKVSYADFCKGSDRFKATF